jgi:hypothetical protein
MQDNTDSDVTIFLIAFLLQSAKMLKSGLPLEADWTFL